MHNSKWLRYGLGSLVLASIGLAGVLVACSDDDNAVNPPDAGGQDASPADGSSGDSGTKPDTGTTPQGSPAKIMFVQAATDFGQNNPAGGIRFCYATASADDPTNFAVAPLPATPHSLSNDAGTLPFPGAFIGTGGLLPSSGADVETQTLRPYLMNAKSLADRGVIGIDPATPRCQKLLSADLPGGPLVANKDYWQLPDIPAGVLKKNKTYLLAVTGCTQDTGVDFVGKCGLVEVDGGMAPFAPEGDNHPGRGNLSIAVLEVDGTTTVGPTEIGFQVVDVSPQYDAIRTQAPQLLPALRPFVGNAPPGPVDAGPDADAAPPTELRADITTAELSFNPKATQAPAMVKVDGIATPTGYIAAAKDSDPTTPGEQKFLVMPLNNTGIPTYATQAGITPSVQALSTGLATDTSQYIAVGKTYTILLVGDPQGPAGSTRKIHFLAFPNVFESPNILAP